MAPGIWKACERSSMPASQLHNLEDVEAEATAYRLLRSKGSRRAHYSSPVWYDMDA